MCLGDILFSVVWFQDFFGFVCFAPGYLLKTFSLGLWWGRGHQVSAVMC